MAQQYIRELAETPFAVRVTVTGVAAEHTVSNVELAVRRGDGTSTTWTSASGQLTYTRTGTTVEIVRVLASGGSDAPSGSAGLWILVPKALLAGGGGISGAPVAVPCLSQFTPTP